MTVYEAVEDVRGLVGVLMVKLHEKDLEAKHTCKFRLSL
jgi:hypothetical protein